MKKICVSELEPHQTCFHFSRRHHRPSIEKDGLVAVAGGENNVMNDRSHPTIYFSKGFEGVLKAVDVWVRYEYYLLYRREEAMQHHDILSTHENIEIRPELMQKALQKVYHDFKNREYYAVELVEGQDYREEDIDVKKRLFRDSNGSINPRAVWMYGEYSNLASDEQEDWNRNTLESCACIPGSRLSLVQDSKERTDALSIVREVFDMMKEQDEIQKLNELKALMEYSHQREIHQREMME